MTSQVSVELWLGRQERVGSCRCQTVNMSALHRCKLIPADLEMDRWRQDRERKWRHHHACREQNRSGRETVRQAVHNMFSGVVYYEPGIETMSGPRKSTLQEWSVISFLAGKLQLRKESREPKSWTSCSSRPVPRQAAMSNRWFLQLPPHFSTSGTPLCLCWWRGHRCGFTQLA